ncbi:MAG: DUF192 domain-containing protein [Nanoarchaeota archaeon]
MQKTISLNYRGKRFNIKAESCNSIGKFSGLMFTRRENAEALLFEFKKSVNLRIHSFFVFFPFLAVWLDKKGKVIEIKKVRPFTVAVSAKKPFTKLLEIPINNAYRNKLNFFRNSPT